MTRINGLATDMLSGAHRGKRRLAVSILAAAISSSMVSTVAAGEGEAEVEVVVVTAQKREQPLQEVPVSVSAFTEEGLAKMNVQNFAEFADTVPGVSFATTGPGASNYMIRGLGQIGEGVAPTTGIYLDETALHTRATRGYRQADPILFDVSRVEVLRGPQGSLFGGSAMGGIVRIITNRPDVNYFEAKVDAGLSTYTDGDESYDVKGMVNVPLIEDELALRAVAVRGHQGGWIDEYQAVTGDDYAGGPGVPLDKDSNTSEYEMFKLSFGYTPDDSLSIIPSVLYQTTDSDTYRYHSDLHFGIEARTKSRWMDTFIEDELMISSLLVEKDVEWFGGMSILSSTAYLDQSSESLFDSTSWRHGQVEGIVGASPNGELYHSGVSDQAETTQLTQEIRVSSQSDATIHWIAGMFYKKMEQSYNRTRPTPNLAALGVVAPGPFGINPTLEEKNIDLEEEEISFFADVTVPLGDSWELTLGGRYFEIDFTDTQNRYGIGGLEAGVQSFAFSETSTDSGFAPRAVVNFAATDDVNLYASYTEGFRPGGTNAPVPDDVCNAQEREKNNIPGTPDPFSPDSTKNYEFGAKTKWLDNRLTVNAALYTIDWQDYQQVVSTICSDDGARQATFTANAGEVESKGGELEFVALLSSEFTLSGGIAITDTSYVDGFESFGLPPGTAALDIPELTWNIRADYSWEVNESLYANMSLAANYVDESISAAGEGERLVRPDHTMVDFAASVSTDVGLTYSFFIDNVTDVTPVYGIEFATNTAPTTNNTSWFSGLTGKPRTVGLRVSMAFD